jgi:zinc transport system ATP-binding protein
MSNFLEVKNLHVAIGGVPILEDVTFSLEKGDVIAIIGPNGAGKTMLFRTLLGLQPYQGEIRWSQPPRIGYVPQRLTIDTQFPLTVEEFFRLKMPHNFWKSTAITDKLIITSLEEVGMAHKIRSRIGELSFGELQRVLISYALFENPNILLFDEPTTGIDIGAEITVYELLRKIADSRDLTMLLISHDLHVIYEFADKVICLNREMLCYGVPRQVLTPQALEELYHHDAAFYEHHHKNH